MKFLFDFFPVLLFFIAFYIPEDPKVGILLATAVAIVASIVQVGIYWLKFRRVETLHLITLSLILLLGGATLLLQDERFIKWKPTAVNWLFAVVFLGSQLIGGKNLLQRIMGGNVSLPDLVWARLNLSWVAFFIVLGLANLYVAYNFDTATWVNFKLFGLMGLTLVFVLGQAVYMARYIGQAEDTKE
ncbi:MAG: septation protein A [Gammaproteobacteria bacterium]|nr:septation protein A [Gammaproteobacteria bacterium]